MWRRQAMEEFTVYGWNIDIHIYIHFFLYFPYTLYRRTTRPKHIYNMQCVCVCSCERENHQHPRSLSLHLCHTHECMNVIVRNIWFVVSISNTREWADSDLDRTWHYSLISSLCVCLHMWNYIVMYVCTFMHVKMASEAIYAEMAGIIPYLR